MLVSVINPHGALLINIFIEEEDDRNHAPPEDAEGGL